MRRLDQTVGGSELYALYKPVADRLRAMLQNSATPSRSKHDLLPLFAEHLQQTGWAAFDAGDNKAAHALYQESFLASQECGDVELAANALAFRAYQLVSNGHDGMSATVRSVALAERCTRPGVQALLYQRAAWTYAVAGDAETTETLLYRSAQALDQDKGDAPDWASWAATELEQDIMSGRCWSVLHRPLRAVPALESAMNEYSDHYSRDKALYLSTLADAYIAAVIRRLGAHNSLPPVAEVLDRAADPA